MKSIYSILVLQRILDHWGIGKISDVTYFDAVGRNTWRHRIETNQGEFELHSYLAENSEAAHKKLHEYLASNGNRTNKKLVHSFDRYHVLLQLSTKQVINSNQVATDLVLLEKLKIMKVFRVYGTILHLMLENEITIYSYASWSIQDLAKGRHNVIVKSLMHSRDKLDMAIEELESRDHVIESIVLKKGWFELYLSGNISLHFHRHWGFPAVEIHNPSRKNCVEIFDESEIYYIRDI